MTKSFSMDVRERVLAAVERDGGESDRLAILLVAPNLSERMGGEALKALQIHLGLLALGYRVTQIAHARVRDELTASYPDLDIVYIDDDRVQIALSRYRLGPLLGLLNAWQLHRMAERQARRVPYDVVHFTSPISPVLPYFRFRGPPTVIGPLNGNIRYPAAFANREPRGNALAGRVLPPLQWLLGQVFRGKRGALILVAGGQRTMTALMLGGCRPESLIPSLDSGVPATLLDRPRPRYAGMDFSFVFLGRLVAYKACDLAIRALAQADARSTLEVIGDGPERLRLERLAQSLGVADRVRFAGWLRAGEPVFERLERCRALVLPSLAEANGIAFQEAMALGVPIICLDWGGPALLMTGGEARMIAPAGEVAVVAAIAAAMDELGSDAAEAERLATRARDKAAGSGFAWPDVLASWVDVYKRAIRRR